MRTTKEQQSDRAYRFGLGLERLCETFDISLYFDSKAGSIYMDGDHWGTIDHKDGSGGMEFDVEPLKEKV